MSRAFRDELPGWVLRGTLSAATSLYWALASDFRHPAELLGMFTGIAIWVLVYAWVSFGVLPGRGHGLASRALKRAVWIKFGITATGWLLFLTPARPLASLAMLDMWLGMVSLSLVGGIGRLFGTTREIATLDSFGWTCLTTVVDGALFAIVIGVIAVATYGWWRSSGRRSPDEEISLARPSEPEGV